MEEYLKNPWRMNIKIDSPIWDRFATEIGWIFGGLNRNSYLQPKGTGAL
jgi:hypothetical protein